MFLLVNWSISICWRCFDVKVSARSID